MSRCNVKAHVSKYTYCTCARPLLGLDILAKGQNKIQVSKLSKKPTAERKFSDGFASTQGSSRLTRAAFDATDGERWNQDSEQQQARDLAIRQKASTSRL